KWHSGAAKAAQKWAEECYALTHDNATGLHTDAFGGCGQNIFISTAQMPWKSNWFRFFVVHPVTYSVHHVRISTRRRLSPRKVELVSLLRPPGWPTRCTTYEYRPGDDFLERKSSCFRYFVHPGDIHGAPCMNIDPATTFSEEVKLFSILRPPRRGSRRSRCSNTAPRSTMSWARSDITRRWSGRRVITSAAVGPSATASAVPAVFPTSATSATTVQRATGRTCCRPRTRSAIAARSVQATADSASSARTRVLGRTSGRTADSCTTRGPAGSATRTLSRAASGANSAAPPATAVEKSSKSFINATLPRDNLRAYNRYMKNSLKKLVRRYVNEVCVQRRISQVHAYRHPAEKEARLKEGDVRARVCIVESANKVLHPIPRRSATPLHSHSYIPWVGYIHIHGCAGQEEIDVHTQIYVCTRTLACLRIREAASSRPLYIPCAYRLLVRGMDKKLFSGECEIHRDVRASGSSSLFALRRDAPEFVDRSIAPVRTPFTRDSSVRVCSPETGNMVVTSVKWAQDAHINWELNERISLSSAGSETVSPSGTNGRASSINNKRQQQQQRRQVQQSLQQQQQQQQQQLQQPQGTPVQRRWNIAKDRLDRTNDALAKRLSVIQELNNKILANYDKMQEGGRRKARWIPKDPSIDAAEPNYNDNDELRDSPAARNEPAKKVSGSFVAEKRRILGEKMNFQRRAGGEWILPSENKANKKRDDSGPVETDKKSNHKCTLLRNQRVASSATTPKSPIGPATTTMQPSASSSPISWIKDESLSTSSSSATSSIAPQESNVLRELNEAIDRFEEQEEEELEEDEDDTKLGHHDSSWDSGVGCDVSLKPAKGTGWLRIHVGQESSLVYLTLETSASDVCRDMLLSENLALFVQVRQVTCCATRSMPWLYIYITAAHLLRRPRIIMALLATLSVKNDSCSARGTTEVMQVADCRARSGRSSSRNSCSRHWVTRSQLGAQDLASTPNYDISYASTWLHDNAYVYSKTEFWPLHVLLTRNWTQEQWCSSIEPRKLFDRMKVEEEEAEGLLGFCVPSRANLIDAAATAAAAIRLPGSSDYPDRLDMSDTGMSRLPEAVRTYASGLPNNNNNNNNNNDDDDENDNRNNNTNNNVALREFFLGNNQLTTSNANLELLHSFPELQELHLENNRLDQVPSELLKLESLVYLDLSDNRIQCLPQEIHRLVK
ncbi:unnamed protein product, partial [Trichogramma brassicae]